MENGWCIVGEGLVKFILESTYIDGQSSSFNKHNTSIFTPIYFSPVNRGSGDLNKTDSWQSVRAKVDRSDLHLKREEIAKLENKEDCAVGYNRRTTVVRRRYLPPPPNKEISDLDSPSPNLEHPLLFSQTIKNDTDSKVEDPYTATESNNENKEDCAGGYNRRTTVVRRRYLPPPPNKELPDLAPYPLDLEKAETINDQLSLTTKIDKISILIDQDEKPNGIKQPHKKKEQSGIIGESVDPISASEHDEEIPPSHRIKFENESLLRLKGIIGDLKKGIKPIIPVSRSTWYKHVKSGRYPKPVQISERCVAWKLSDILALRETF
ncbi:MAG: AlpA family phage regulatory protein [Deltaproteobacteria bacterium]|nr:AlpA family phage regulatory protein [Deltaproteobacteria bacterium]